MVALAVAVAVIIAIAAVLVAVNLPKNPAASSPSSYEMANAYASFNGSAAADFMQTTGYYFTNPSLAKFSTVVHVGIEEDHNALFSSCSDRSQYEIESVGVNGNTSDGNELAEFTTAGAQYPGGNTTLPILLPVGGDASTCYLGVTLVVGVDKVLMPGNPIYLNAAIETGSGYP